VSAGPGGAPIRVIGAYLSPYVRKVLDYLESRLPASGWLFGSLWIADISIAVVFRNATFARYRVDPGRWPVTASFVDRVLAQDCLAKLQAHESVMLRTPIPGQRAALRAAGAPVAAETLGAGVPRPGVTRLR
jgi:glutathione S-transferase